MAKYQIEFTVRDMEESETVKVSCDSNNLRVVQGLVAKFEATTYIDDIKIYKDGKPATLEEVRER